MTTSWVRSLASSLVRILDTCDLQVSGLMNSRAAISELVRPPAISARDLQLPRGEGARERELGRRSLIGVLLMGIGLDQAPGGPRLQQRVPPGDGPHRLDQHRRLGSLEQEPARSRL